MDDFKDLDREISRLKKELECNDGLLHQLQYPEINDYWKRRLDEEKILWNKKMASSDEQRKALEMKISSQQERIDRYNQTLKEIERKMEEESKQWEDRLRIKEADILIEKNRMLSEDRVRKAEFENQKLLIQISELNGKINEIRENNKAEIEKINENRASERGLYEEKLKINLSELELTQKRAQELDERLKEKQADIEKANKEFEDKLKDAQKTLLSVSEERTVIEKEKSALKIEIGNQKSRLDEEIRQTTGQYNGIMKRFADNLKRCTGVLSGLVEFASNHNAGRNVWKIFAELIQNAENETDKLIVDAKIEYSYNQPFKTIIVLTDDDFSLWDEALKNTQAQTERASLRGLDAEIIKTKPQAIVISSRYLGKARKIKRQYPFLPIIVSGDIKNKLTKSLLSEGFVPVKLPCLIGEITSKINSAAYNSIAQPEYWGKIKVKKPYLLYSVVLCSLVSGILVGYMTPNLNLRLNLGKVQSFSTPYLQPTNLTFDGQYLWTCDWFGQCIYKHKINGELGLDRIFYFPEKHFSALSWAGGSLWSVDPWEGKINKHNSDENLTIVASYTAPGLSPTGLAGDGSILWSCDSYTAKIYRHRLDEELTIETVYKSPGTNPSGLYFDGQHLWSIDGKTNTIYKHKLDKQLTVVNSYLAPGYEQKGYNLSGIAKSGDNLWVCSEKAGKIYKYPLESLKKINN